MVDFFRHNIEDDHLEDVEPIKLIPTWRNNKSGEARISKRLYKFLVYGVLLNDFDRIRSWMEVGGGLDHFTHSH